MRQLPPAELRRRAWLALLAIAAGLLLPGASCTPILPESAGPARAVSDQWQVQWDPLLETPSSLVNRTLSQENSSGTPIGEPAAIDAVLRVFRENDSWFRLRAEDGFRPVYTHVRGFLRLVRVEQTYRGLPVGGGGYEAHVLPNGRVGSIDGRFYPDIRVDVTPSIGDSEAEARARAAFPLGGQSSSDVPMVQFESEHRFQQARESLVFPRGGRYLLAWGVVVPSTSRDWIRVYVDAANGEVIGRQAIGWNAGR